VRYVETFHSVSKLPNPQSRTSSLVKSSIRQNDEIRRTRSAAT
jgi:hypothetical protein